MIFNELELCFETSLILRNNLEPKSWSIILCVAGLIFHWQRRERSRRLTVKKEVSSESWLMKSEYFFERPSFDRSHLISLGWNLYQDNIASERWTPSQLILLNSCNNGYLSSSGFDRCPLETVLSPRGVWWRPKVETTPTDQGLINRTVLCGLPTVDWMTTDLERQGQSDASSCLNNNFIFYQQDSNELKTFERPSSCSWSQQSGGYRSEEWLDNDCQSVAKEADQ